VIWAYIQKLIYEEVPFYKVGDFNALTAKSPRLQGFTASPWPYFWNASLKQ
jgi:peptide/nickel transport system substrate-binding protein